MTIMLIICKIHEFKVLLEDLLAEKEVVRDILAKVYLKRFTIKVMWLNVKMMFMSER